MKKIPALLALTAIVLSSCVPGVIPPTQSGETPDPIYTIPGGELPAPKPPKTCPDGHGNGHDCRVNK